VYLLDEEPPVTISIGAATVRLDTAHQIMNATLVGNSTRETGTRAAGSQKYNADAKLLDEELPVTISIRAATDRLDIVQQIMNATLGTSTRESGARVAESRRLRVQLLYTS